ICNKHLQQRKSIFENRQSPCKMQIFVTNRRPAITDLRSRGRAIFRGLRKGGLMAGATMAKIVSLCKRRGFLFQGSDLYGGLQATWDYGPVAVEVKNNIKRAWGAATVFHGNGTVGCAVAI